MADAKTRFQQLLEELKRQRDELALQVHLGKAEAVKEWERLEKKWEQLKSDSRPLLEAVDESASGVGAALDLARGELEKGYVRLRELLKEKK